MHANTLVSLMLQNCSISVSLFIPNKITNQIFKLFFTYLKNRSTKPWYWNVIVSFTSAIWQLRNKSICQIVHCVCEDNFLCPMHFLRLASITVIFNPKSLNYSRMNFNPCPILYALPVTLTNAEYEFKFIFFLVNGRVNSLKKSAFYHAIKW